MKKLWWKRFLSVAVCAAALLALVPLTAVPARAEGGTGAFAQGGLYTDFHFPAVETLRGIFSTAGMYVSMPDYAIAKSATLRFSYTCSDLILEELSSLTFYMNGTPFYSCPVSYSPEGATVVYADVPLYMMRQEYNLLEVGSYVRLTREEGCVDDYMGANWINIGEQTCLRVGYGLIDDKNYLCYYPYPFLSLMDPSGANLTVAVPDGASDEELAAALIAVAGLGASVAEQNDITVARISDAPEGGNVILFSLEENLSPGLRAQIGDIGDGGCAARRFESGGGEWLAVVSRDGEGLAEGARLLSDAARVGQLWTDAYFAKTGESERIAQNLKVSDAVVRGTYTLKEVLGHGIRLSGPFHQETTVYLPVPGDYILSGESKFSFKMRYSENLDFSRSLMTVFWGDTPIASRKLSAEAAGGDMLTFTVPADLAGIPGSYIRIAFELEIEDMVCTPRQMDMPWAYVAEDSSMYLPLGKTGALDLANRPAPFQRDGRLNDVLAVFSDEPDARELNLMGRTFAMLGASADPYGALKVIRSREFDEADADYNIVTAGGAGNAFIRNVNSSLYFAYDESFSSLLSTDALALTDSFAATLGAVELFRSPFADGRALLVLTSPSAGGIERLTELISADALRWNMRGDAVIIDERGAVRSYQSHATETAAAERPGVRAMFAGNPESTAFALIAIGVMAILLLAVALVLVRMRRRTRNGADGV